MTKRKKSKLIGAIIRSGVRIICLIVFLHWIFWFTSYANCVNYCEGIEDDEISIHNEETEKYKRFNGWFNEQKKTDITTIEEDVLSQIEAKTSKPNDESIRKWKNEEFPKLEELSKEIENLDKKENKSQTEKEELDKKRIDYKKKLEEAKKRTVENIKKQLKDNDLNITDLDDKRNWVQILGKDTMKFFFVTPLNIVSKTLGLHNHLLLEIIFKLVIIKLLIMWVRYSEVDKFWESMEKLQNPYLSVEEKEAINQENAPLFTYVLFNGAMFFLSFFIFLHPFFLDRTNPKYIVSTPWYWFFPFYGSLLLSSFSTEFVRQKRMLTRQEIKAWLAKSWLIILIFSLLLFFVAAKFFPYGDSWGSYLFSLCGGLIEFAINLIRVKFFSHKVHEPTGTPKFIRR